MTSCMRVCACEFVAALKSFKGLIIIYSIGSLGLGCTNPQMPKAITATAAMAIIAITKSFPVSIIFFVLV